SSIAADAHVLRSSRNCDERRSIEFVDVTLCRNHPGVSTRIDSYSGCWTWRRNRLERIANESVNHVIGARAPNSSAWSDADVLHVWGRVLLKREACCGRPKSITFVWPVPTRFKRKR